MTGAEGEPASAPGYGDQGPAGAGRDPDDAQQDGPRDEDAPGPDEEDRPEA